VEYGKSKISGAFDPGLIGMLRGGAITVHWNIIQLNWNMDSSLEEVEERFASNITYAIESLQQEWPDHHLFRVKLLNEVLHFEEQMSDTMQLQVSALGTVLTELRS
jgi:hypothetical protein